VGCRPRSLRSRSKCRYTFAYPHSSHLLIPKCLPRFRPRTVAPPQLVLHPHWLSSERAHYHASFAHNESTNWDSETSREGWGPRRGWADEFGAPKDQQSEWNRDGWRERLVLSFGVMVRSLLLFGVSLLRLASKALLAGLFSSLPAQVRNLFLFMLNLY
jgi:hypothetical protein